MRKQRTVLGLDVGVSSIGWGLVQLEEEQYEDDKYRICDGKIIDSGVRTFQIPQDRQKKSLALIRGVARRSRRTTKRKGQRLKRLVRLGKEFGLIGEEFRRERVLKPKKGDGEGNWDIWLIRKEGLERKLTDIELFRVLYHIAKHRGFHFHTKAEEMSENQAGSEDGKVKAGLAGIRKKLKDGDWETVGQMFWGEFKQSNPKNKRKRNAKDKYEKSIHRSLLREEIEKIFECQRKLEHPKAKEELQQRYIEEVLMHEEGINEEKLRKMMGHCEFTGERCAPRKSYTAERFSLFNRLNTLELVDTQNKNRSVSLDEGQRSKIESLAYKNAQVKFSQIRNELKLKGDLHLRFNLCSYSETNPEYSKKLVCSVEKGKLKFDDKHKVPIVDIRTGETTFLDGKIKDVFKSKKLYPNSKKIHVYYSDIRKQLDLSGEVRFAKLSGYTKSVEELGSEEKYIKQFEERQESCICGA